MKKSFCFLLLILAMSLFFIEGSVLAMGNKAGGVPQKKIKIYDAVHNKVIEVDTIFKTDPEWKKVLAPEQYEVTTNKGTEKPFTCTFGNIKGSGLYKCVRCGTDLFLAKTKFESGTGWPSFFEPVSNLNVIESPDNSYGMRRIEVKCARCGAHLGHVFDDGPPPTGKRYCINGVALRLVKLNSGKPAIEKAAFAAGCFWHVQEEFDKLKGVVDTTVGYTGGSAKNPTYEKVCTNTTGHAETVMVEFDPSVVSYDKLLDLFWEIHDPTAVNRQGPDVGSQYRSAIFYFSDEQKKAALKSKEMLEKSGKYKNRIVTEIKPASEFYRAEEYHQKYIEKQGQDR